MLLTERQERQKIREKPQSHAAWAVSGPEGALVVEEGSAGERKETESSWSVNRGFKKRVFRSVRKHYGVVLSKIHIPEKLVNEQGSREYTKCRGINKLVQYNSSEPVCNFLVVVYSRDVNGVSN
ncbi:hypothetical protein RhiirC2_708413 [Rhizophagus irregularis]|uniref:Uncharacterized protein n=1 Tax=Rhizophagus irregularis TaxID=588596 RepID=A0A2N1NMI6_9GLOM|nr:hypothetical protein RhiirC2_708413 [Rhizophagus irregularis]